MSTFGCRRCFGDDADTAWTASREVALRALVDESHFGVRLTACRCGQRFVSVFLERVDWVGGEDDQTWLVLPVREDEAARLEACAEDALSQTLADVGRERRFLARAFPTGGALSAWWRDSGFSVGPHD